MADISLRHGSGSNNRAEEDLAAAKAIVVLLEELGAKLE